MALRLADVKKTVRTRADGDRYLHPKLLDLETAALQVELAIGYFNSRLGRVRRDLDPEMLVRFFGDAKLARGLVSCLGTSYRWREQTFADVLDEAALARLTRKGLHTPTDLRLHLFDAMNAEGDGFLASPRDEALALLASRFGLPSAKLDQLVSLDAEEHAVLLRAGPVPDSTQVVRTYNQRVIDALLRHCAFIDLPAAAGASAAALSTICQGLGIAVECQDGGLRLHNRADLFGSYARWGQNLARALYHALADNPSLARGARVRIPLGGKAAWFLFDRAAMIALTGRTGRIRYGSELLGFVDNWREVRGTAGWRLVSRPEPAVSAAGLAVAPFAFRRDEVRVLLWPVSTAEDLAQAVALRAAGEDVLAYLAGDLVPGAGLAARARQTDGAAGIVAALLAGWGGTRVDAAEQAIEALMQEVQVLGFMAEDLVVERLGCATLAEAIDRMAVLNPARGIYVDGVGLCSPAFAENMRRGLRRKPGRKPAA